MNDTYTIRELECLSGIKAHTIRMWEQRYGLLKPQRSHTNIRSYDCAELKRLLNIALLNRNGYRISDIHRMDEADLHASILSLFRSDARCECRITRLMQLMLDLQAEQFEKTLEADIRKNGLQDCLTEVIFPFLQRMDVLWSTDHINAAQDRLVTNIVRQKLIAGIEKAGSCCAGPETATALLFLPEGEFHELGLLYLCYLLKRQGHNVLYLGANIPLGDVNAFLVKRPADYLCLHLTSTLPAGRFEEFLRQLNARFKGKKIMLCGPLVSRHHVKAGRFPNIQISRSAAEINAFAESLCP
ncbi:MerR family transcriptional regulator [Compostibacter hankyongensis]